MKGGGEARARQEGLACGPARMHAPDRHSVSYGCVLVDASGRRVMLRAPSAGPVVSWTFALSMPLNGERPQDTAVRAAREGYGWIVRLVDPIPQWFLGFEWSYFCWLAEPIEPSPQGLHWDTDEAAWFTWKRAASVLARHVQDACGERNLEILEAARRVLGGAGRRGQVFQGLEKRALERPRLGSGLPESHGQERGNGQGQQRKARKDRKPGERTHDAAAAGRALDR
jgi:hypothetical protein